MFRKYGLAFAWLLAIVVVGLGLLETLRPLGGSHGPGPHLERSEQNLREISIAMAKHQGATGTLPPQAIFDKKGQPLLSWRVQILPYLSKAPFTTASTSTSLGTARTTKRDSTYAGGLPESKQPSRVRHG